MKLRTLVLMLGSALALLPIPPAVAEAGTYEVLSCDAALGDSNQAWTFETNDLAHVQGSATCPSAGAYSGLLVQDKLNSLGASIGTYGQWRLRAPADTVISRIQLSRMLGTGGGTGWRPYGRVDGDTFPGETCAVAPGYDECNIDGHGSAPIDYAVAAASIAYGIECISASGCVTGATLHEARAAIYSSRVSINDPVSPSLGSPAGALITEAGYHHGTETVTFGGRDNTGLQALRVYVDGVQRSESTLDCDYTYTVPDSRRWANAQRRPFCHERRSSPHSRRRPQRAGGRR